MSDRLALRATSFVVPASHPALPGHFPGNPVVPGVVVLEQVICAFEAVVGRPVRLHGLKHAKFLLPLLPGQITRVTMETGRDLLSFRVYRGSSLICKGAFELGNGSAT